MARPRNETPKYTLIQVGERYYISWTERGRNRRRSTRETDEKLAQKYLDRYMAARESAPPETPTAKSILEGYLTAKKESARAYATQEHSAKPLIAFFGNLQISDITEATVKRYALQRGRANGTIIRELGVLRASLHWAERAKWITSGTAPKFHMPVKSPPGKNRWLTKEEARSLLDAATTPHLRLFILIGIYTGARKGAIMELKWNQINKTLIDFGTGHGNKRRAQVPISDALKEEFKAHFEVRTTDYVIEYQGKPIKQIDAAWRTATQKAGLDKVTPHTLRHTAATWMVMDGVPLRKIARMLGDTERVIEQTYGHHAPDYLSDAVKALSF